MRLMKLARSFAEKGSVTDASAVFNDGCRKPIGHFPPTGWEMTGRRVLRR